jgi:hypothetical protein
LAQAIPACANQRRCPPLENRGQAGRLSYFFIPEIRNSHFPFGRDRFLIEDMSNKHEIAEKPAAAPEKTAPKAVAAAAGARAPHGPTTVATKREYPTLGYE